MSKFVIYNKKQVDKKEQLNEPKFLEELRAGSQSAYHRLYEAFGKEIFRYIRSYFPKDYATTEDIFQEVFITAYLKIGSLNDAAKVRAWFYRIASNKCIDHKRKLKREEKNVAEYYENYKTLHKESVEEKILENELRDALHNEILSLPDFLRKVFILREYQNMQYDEITEVLDSSLSKVKKAMAKAVLKLSERIKKNLGKDILL